MQPRHFESHWHSVSTPHACHHSTSSWYSRCCGARTATCQVPRKTLETFENIGNVFLSAAVSTLRSDLSVANAAAAAAAKSIDVLSESTRSRVAAVEAACGSICKETLLQVASDVPVVVQSSA